MPLNRSRIPIGTAGSRALPAARQPRPGFDLRHYSPKTKRYFRAFRLETNLDYDSVKDVTFGEVLEGLHRENSGSKSYAWAENRLKQADGLCIGRWALVILDKADIANIVLPAHRHGIELVPDSGLAVSATAEVLRSFP